MRNLTVTGVPPAEREVDDRVNILLVDDRPENLMVLEAILAPLGQNLFRAGSGEEALRLALEHRFAVILMDVRMPRMSGIETATLIRGREATRETPIIFVTAGARSDISALEGYSAGAVDYLHKPLIPAVVRAKVATFVDLARKTRVLEEEIARRREAEEALRQVEAELRERVNERTLALRESEERFRLLVEGSRDFAIYTLDAGGRITSWNLGASLMLGYTGKEVLGTPCSRFFRAEDVERGLPQEELRAALRDGRYAEEGWRVRRDGTVFPASVVVTALYDSDGNLRGFGKVVRDLTEQKTAEKLLREAQGLFRDFMDHSPALAWVRDRSGRIVYVNATYQRFFRASWEQLEGTTLTDRVPRATAAVLGDLYARVLQEGRLIQEDHVIPDKEGALHILRFYVFPIHTDAGERLLGGMAFDVSEQRQLEEQLRQAQKMEAIGRLAGGVAHDFNNMLAVIIGFSDLALDRMPAEDPLYEMLREIRTAGERASNLTRQLLAFSRRQIVTPRLLDLNEAVASMDGMLRRLIGEDIELRTLPASAPALVHADPGQIEQVLLNLAVNARDAMPEGGELTIEVQEVELDATYARQHAEVKAGPYVMVAVSDTGAGMDTETQSRIFEPFFTTKAPGEGTGLGLSTVFGIVNQCGGHVWVYSEPAHGASFKIYLPRAGDGVEAAPAPEPGPPGARGTETVLLLEDDALVRGMARAALEERGFRVLEAATPEEAFGLAGEHQGGIDVLLTDVVMPQMSGREAAERLKQQLPGLNVLYMSGYTDDAVVRHGVLSGGAAFIQKPFTLADLTRKLREILDQPNSTD